ncbi:hypothetical protein B0H17DRAFT_1139853 [Mycena rosella]|uniref:Uncharacterized protein n=1 Tax=Mycena rosella TaxID=1033263 RepID=A0AAD7D325_MYCRO|nr:hypothetical protein B0H17DRAFT_1139853 [Mycena rosella]
MARFHPQRKPEFRILESTPSAAKYPFAAFVCAYDGALDAATSNGVPALHDAQLALGLRAKSALRGVDGSNADPDSALEIGHGHMSLFRAPMHGPPCMADLNSLSAPPVPRQTQPNSPRKERTGFTRFEAPHADSQAMRRCGDPAFSGHLSEHSSNVLHDLLWIFEIPTKPRKSGSISTTTFVRSFSQACYIRFCARMGRGFERGRRGYDAEFGAESEDSRVGVHARVLLTFDAEPWGFTGGWDGEFDFDAEPWDSRGVPLEMRRREFVAESWNSLRESGAELWGVRSRVAVDPQDRDSETKDSERVPWGSEPEGYKGGQQKKGRGDRVTHPLAREIQRYSAHKVSKIAAFGLRIQECSDAYDTSESTIRENECAHAARGWRRWLEGRIKAGFGLEENRRNDPLRSVAGVGFRTDSEPEPNLNRT